jgi:hypothetical protein
MNGAEAWCGGVCVYIIKQRVLEVSTYMNI